MYGGFRGYGRGVIPNLCNETDQGNPNVDALHGMLAEIGCMYSKLAGSSDEFRVDVSQLEDEAGRLRCALECCEQDKLSLESEIRRLEEELRKCRSCLDEQCDARKSLEKVICDLRAEIDCLDEKLCVSNTEKSRLLSEVDRLCIANEQLLQNLQQLEGVKSDLQGRLLCYEDNGILSERRRDELQRAMEDCCKNLDELTSENCVLKTNINRLQRDLEDVVRERDDLLRKLKEERDKFEADKRNADQLIQALKDKVSCLEAQQDSSCQRFEASIKAHHVKLDEMNEERKQLERLLDEERKIRMDLERRLRECEESKRNGSAYVSHAEMPKMMDCVDCSQYDDKVKKLEGERSRLLELNGSIQDKNKALQFTLAQRETELSQAKLEYEHELGKLKIHKSNLEKDLMKIRAEYEAQLKSLTEKMETVMLERDSNANNLVDIQVQELRQLETRGILTDPDEYYEELVMKIKNLKRESRQLKKLVNERDETISSLQSSVGEVKTKYSEHLRNYRLQKIEMEALRSQLDKMDDKSGKEMQELEKQKLILMEEKRELEREKMALEIQARTIAEQKATIEGLSKMKDNIEEEIYKLKTTLSTQLVNKSEVDRLRSAYEIELNDLKSKFETQLEMNRQLAEINDYLGKQSKDRELINAIRDSNDNLLRKELSSVTAALKLDTEKLQKMIKERDHEIVSLRKAIQHLKSKYATEAQEKEELIKKVQILSSISQESLLDSIREACQTKF